MQSNEVPSGITRVVVDGDSNIEIAELQSVMLQIQQSLQQVPHSRRGYIGNALLNLAVSQMLRDIGAQRTSTVLIRLIDAVLESDTPPPPGAAVDLTTVHS